jgi:zinc protease
MRKVILLVAAAVLLMPLSAFTEEDYSDVFVGNLDNGLKVAIKENHSAPVVAVRIYVKTTGGVWEKEYLGAGISHYCEHLVSGGTTPTRTEAEADEIERKIGAQTNAYTSSDHTCYYMTCPSMYFDTALDVLSDWVMNCSLIQFEVDREHGVIDEEISMGENEPGRVLWNQFLQTVFNESEIRFPTIGYRENFLRLTRDDVSKFYNERYIPNNTVIVVVGDIDADTVYDQIEQVMGSWERRTLHRPVLHQEPQQHSRRRTEREMDTNVTYLRMGWPTISYHDTDLYAMDLLSYILTNGESAPMVELIKDEKQLVYNISSGSYTPTFGKGVFYFDAVLDYSNVEATIAAVENEIERLKTELVSVEDFDRAVQQQLAADVFGNQTIQAQANQIGRDLVYFDDPYFGRRYARRMAEVTREEIRDVVREYFNPRSLNVALIRPFGTDVAEDVATEEQVDVGEAELTTLDSGLRLVTRENPHVPLVAIHARFAGGSRFEDDATNGTCNFMSEMLLKGTENRTADEIASTIEGLGGSINSFSDRNSFGVSLAVLSKDVDTAIDVLADVLVNPTFPQDEMEKLRKEITAEIESQSDDWQYEAVNFYQSVFYDKHPYRLNPVGKVSVVETLTSDDLRSFYSDYLTAPNGVIAVYGDMDSDRIVEKLRTALEELSTETPPIPEISPEPAEDTEVVEYKYNDKTQSVICLGYPGLEYDSKDRFALDVLDAVTSGKRLPSGWLHEALRGREDLVYFVHLIPRHGIESGNILILAQCNPENKDKAIEIMKEEIERAKRGEFAEDEVEAGKASCIAARQIYDLQTNGSQASTATFNELFGYGYDFDSDYDARINQVTIDDLIRVAKKYFTSPVLAVVIPKQEGES